MKEDNIKNQVRKYLKQHGSINPNRARVNCNCENTHQLKIFINAFKREGMEITETKNFAGPVWIYNPSEAF